MTRPLLCATVTGSTTGELIAARDAAVRADLVEVRLDYAASPDAAAVVAGRARPVLVTCRAAWEGGRFAGSEEERERLLVAALDAGAEYVDVEWAAGFRDRLVARAPARVVVSCHDFERVPADLRERFGDMAARGAAVVKIAVRVDALSHMAVLFDLAARARRDGVRVVLLAMGPSGVPSRVLAARLGNCWTYAGDGVAPGQLTADTLLDDYRFARIREDAAVFGVLGRPVSHSLSPAIHNAAFAAAGLDAVFVPLEAIDFGDFERFAEVVGLRGVAVTAPFKLDAFRAASSMDDLARDVGAVNTLRRGREGWEARNTDVPGFLASLGDEPLAGRRAAILGAGGAARAVIVALHSRGVHVSVSARRRESAERLASATAAAVAAYPPAPGSWDLLVNATPVGTWPDVDASPLPASALGGEGLVSDLVYNPPETALMRHALAAGHRVLGGLDMLVAQAAEQFRFWTGADAPVGEMRTAANAALARARRR